LAELPKAVLSQKNVAMNLKEMRRIIAANRKSRREIRSGHAAQLLRKEIRDFGHRLQQRRHTLLFLSLFKNARVFFNLSQNPRHRKIQKKGDDPSGELF